MKVHQLAHGFWDHEPSLSLSCKRLRPLAPKLANTDGLTTVDLKSFIKAESGVGSNGSTDEKRDVPQAEAHSGGTRWNPTQEQIGILEMLYKSGMRTPNAQQIEQITVQLGNYGKIEGKNVFYWFQNHKARERQRQKRNCLSFNTSPTALATASLAANVDEEVGKEEDNYCKRKCRSWGIHNLVEEDFTGGEEENKTLELFPLHPEGR